jgi:tetratricopeptide (TPR) repeat protein
MAIRKRCLYCGAPVRTNDYCTECGLQQEFLKKAYNTSGYHYNIGLDKARARDLSGAIDSLKMSLRYNKQNVEARNLLGLVYYELGEVVMAMSHWVMSANYKPKDNPAIRYLQELRDDPKKLEEVNQTARMYNQALVYAKQRDFDLAFIQLRKVIAGNPHFVNGHLLLALLYMEQGREGKARKSLSRVLAIDRTNTTAIHLLRELGETEETIIRIRDDSEEREEEGASYYGVFQTEENPSGGRPARKIQPVRPVDKTRDRRVRRYKEVNLAKFSNIYMILGMCIGVLIFYFLVIPVKSKSYQQQVSDVETTYSEQIALKNSIISNLNNQITGLDSQAAELQEENEALQDQVTQLENQVEQLKNQIPEDTTEEGDEGNGENPEEGSANGIDLPDGDINNMINNE